MAPNYYDTIGYCECGCGEQPGIAVSDSSSGGVQAGERLRFVNGHNKRKYRSVDGLYRCRDCEGLFVEGQITRDRNRHGEQQDVGYCRKCAKARNDWSRKENAAEHKLWVLKSHLKYKYGLTLDGYQSLYQGQGGRCKICGIPRKSRLECGVKRGDVLHVDHCHKTGKVRGLLCDGCNLSIGRMKEDPNVLRAAADYLETT